MTNMKLATHFICTPGLEIAIQEIPSLTSSKKHSQLLCSIISILMCLFTTLNVLSFNMKITRVVPRSMTVYGCILITSTVPMLLSTQCQSPWISAQMSWQYHGSATMCCTGYWDQSICSSPCGWLLSTLLSTGQTSHSSYQNSLTWRQHCEYNIMFSHFLPNV